MSNVESIQARGPVIRLGVSPCLLGESARYDSGHKLDHCLVDTLGQYVERVPDCPEVEIGLSIPRESMRLVGDPDAPRLVAKSGTDYTDRMKAWAAERLEQLAAQGLCGFVFKKGSPSSGLFRVKIYDEHGMPSRSGAALFPREVMRRFPLLPLEEEGRLNDLPLRANLIERIFAYYRWSKLLEEDPTPGGLVRFHTAHKLTLMAHSPKHYTEMGRLVAQAGTVPWAELTATYGRLFMEGLALLGTRRKHVNAEGPALDGLPEEGPIGRRQAGVAGVGRGLSAGAGAADRALDIAQAPPTAASRARLGVAAGVPEPVSERADAAESCVTAMRRCPNGF